MYPITLLIALEKKECINGHKYTDGSWYIDKHGTKRCRMCHRQQSRQRYYSDIEESRKKARINSKNWRAKNHEHVLEIERRSDKKRYSKKLIYWQKHYPDYKTQLEKEVYSHYGNGEAICVNCGEDTSNVFLTIDHIKNNGANERRIHKGRGGWKLLQWLRSNNYPSGFRTLCWNCNHILRINPKIKLIKNASKHTLYMRNYSIEYNKIVKEIVLKHYGNNKLSCVCCGFDNINALTLDHINGREKWEIKNSKRRGTNLYKKLKSEGYPKGYQTLCFNCNSGRARNEGICPHKEIK